MPYSCDVRGDVHETSEKPCGAAECRHPEPLALEGCQNVRLAFLGEALVGLALLRQHRGFRSGDGGSNNRVGFELGDAPVDLLNLGVEGRELLDYVVVQVVDGIQERLGLGRCQELSLLAPPPG